MSSNGSRKRAGASLKRPQKKPRKPVSDDEESNDSVLADQVQEPPREPSPLPDETAEKLPEELLKTFYKTPGVLLIAGLVSWDLVAKRDNNPQKKTHPNLFTFHKFTDIKYRLIVSGCSAGHSILISEEGDAYTFGRNTCGQLGFGDTTTRHEPELVPALQGLNIISAAVGRHHSLFVTDTGTVYACGDNKSGQCGLGITSPMVTKPTRIRHTGAPIVKVGCGAEFSMILDCNGDLHSFGLPEYGQLGHNTDGKYFVTSTKLSYHFETVPKKITFFYEKSKDGHVTPIKDVTIVDFSCGNNHTVAIDSSKRAFSWGFGGFGRLGHAEQKDESVPRLIKYFDSQARGVRSVHCGATYSLAVNELDNIKKSCFKENKTGKETLHQKKEKKHVTFQDTPQVIYFTIEPGNTMLKEVRRLRKRKSTQQNHPEHINLPGPSPIVGRRNIPVECPYSTRSKSKKKSPGALFMFGQTKRTGEANMYPKPVQDLAGWNIRSVGTSNTSIVIAADDSLIAWGVSPTYGELGTGVINKSTARPKEVSSMEGLNITQVAMGFSHTLLLCNDNTEEVKQKLASLPTFKP